MALGSAGSLKSHVWIPSIGLSSTFKGAHPLLYLGKVSMPWSTLQPAICQLLLYLHCVLGMVFIAILLYLQV